MEYNLDDIKQIVAKLFQEQFSLEQINVDDNYFDGNIANSIDALELLMEIETVFNFSIDDEELSADLISSVNNVSNYIYKKIN